MCVDETPGLSEKNSSGFVIYSPVLVQAIRKEFNKKNSSVYFRKDTRAERQTNGWP